jgi:hypothetical protein
MLRLKGRVVPSLWCLYAAHERAAGGNDGAWWTDATGTLAAAEADALDLLQTRLQDDAAVRRELVAAVGRGERSGDQAVDAALDALAPRAARVYEAAGPMLRRWATAIRAEQPGWLEQLGAVANTFYGTAVGVSEPFEYGLFLLPAAPERAGRSDALFVPGQGSSLECAGDPSDEVLGHLSHVLLHSALHEGQRARADSLLTAHLASPQGSRTGERFDASPAAARQRRLFGRSLQGLVPHLSETIVHAFAYEGVLR